MARAAVDAEDSAVGECEAEVAGQGAEPGLVAVGDDALGPAEGAVAAGDVVGAGVGAAALVAVEADAVVVVPGEGGDASGADGFDDFIGEGAVADEIAEAYYVLVGALPNVGEEGVEGVPVGVDIGEGGNGHGGPSGV